MTVRSSKPPETRFLQTEQGAIGYQVFGSGPEDLVFISHWLTNVDMFWEEPSAVRYFDRLGSMGRVILIDKLASGVSDPSPSRVVPPVEDHMDHTRAVMAEVGVETATLIGDCEGGYLAMLLAATYPETFPRLVLINAAARLSRADDYEIGAPPAAIENMKTAWLLQHGTSGDVLHLTAPSVADDPRFRSWFVRFQRAAQRPSAAAFAVEWIASTDVRSALPSIQAETLVIARNEAQFHRPIFGEYIAEHIAGARFEKVDGADTLPFHSGDFGPTLDLVEEFITGASRVPDSNRVLATVVFTDIVGSTATAADMGDEKWLDLRNDHDRLIRRNLDRFRGQEVAMTGDGTLATFDGPLRAIQFAIALREELATIGIDIRAGIHTGEVEKRDGELGGIAVHIAARVMAQAETGGIMASSTVKDLVVGSPVAFEACGSFGLKGVPGSWNLFEVESAGAV